MQNDSILIKKLSSQTESIIVGMDVAPPVVTVATSAIAVNKNKK